MEPRAPADGMHQENGEFSTAPEPVVRQPLRCTRYCLTFVTMMIFWVVFSGRFDAFHLSLGVISSALVSYLSSDLLYQGLPTGHLFRLSLRFLRYLPWLLWQIFLANLHVLRLTFHPRMHQLIDPHIVRFRSELTGDAALVTFANSITLTPGTITVRVSPDGDFAVHAIDRPSGEALPGDMELRIMRAFEGEN